VGYSELYPVGSRVEIASRDVLERYQRPSYQFHDPISDVQLGFAGRTATVATVNYYFGGDALYTLDDVPGVWLEECLRLPS
jgi:hypothetical protein